MFKISQSNTIINIPKSTYKISSDNKKVFNHINYEFINTSIIIPKIEDKDTKVIINNSIEVYA